MIRKYSCICASLAALALAGSMVIGASSDAISETDRRYLKLDELGKPVADKLGPWACVVDRETGLVWEVKSPQEDIHYRKSMYSWHQAQASVGVKGAGTCHSGESLYSCDSSDLLQVTRRQNYCGLSNWRLPKVAELQTIIYSQAHEGRALTNPYLFPRTYKGPYWSSDIASEIRATQYPGQGLELKEIFVSTVHFGSGKVGRLEASRSAPVRLVASLNP